MKRYIIYEVKNHATAVLRHSLLLVLLAFCLPCAHAQVTLGYCDEATPSGSLSNSSTTALISCSMGLTPALTADYTFCSISFLRIYLTEPDHLTSLSVWVRSRLDDAECLTAIDVEPSTLATGWNDIALPSPIRLSPPDTCYCGYSYTQNAKTAIPTSGTRGTGQSFFVSTGNGWRDMSGRYAPVCIRAGLSSNHQYAVGLTGLALSHRWHDIGSTGDTITLYGTVRNLGSEPLQRFDITVEDSDKARYDSTCLVSGIGFGQSMPFEFRFPRADHGPLTSPDIPVTVTVSQPNGQSNECDHPTSRTVYYEVGQGNPDPGSTPAPLLIEEFTSENNGYAPAGQTHLRNAIARALESLGPDSPSPIVLSRHEGYGPADSWRVAGSDYDPSLFGPQQLSFAPAAMVGRAAPPFSTTLPEDSIARLIISGPATPYGSIRIEAPVFDPTSRTLSAIVRTRLFGISVFRNPTLVVCVKQDKAPSVAQKNYYPERYDSRWLPDVVRSFAVLPDQGSLLAGLDLDAVATGQVAVGDRAEQQFEVSLSLPADVTSADGLSLVAYIFDRGFTRSIITASELKF